MGTVSVIPSFNALEQAAKMHIRAIFDRLRRQDRAHTGGIALRLRLMNAG